jgi:chemotaxis protein methyltransferase CheR
MEISNKQIIEFHKAVRESSEYDFSNYSVNSLKRRLSRITEEYGSDLNLLLKTIRKDSVALEEVIKKITVNTTELFRDTKIWQRILFKLLPQFIKQSSINIWHPGCSSGQEVYSMMIILDQLGILERSNIYASDINTDVLDKARQGSYRLRFHREYIENFKTVFSVGRQGNPTEPFLPMEKYFKIDEARDQIQMLEFLLNKPIYKKINLVKDDNLFSINFDIIMCRNVIIYFNYDLQNRVINLFHRNLRENGCLVLGAQESIIGPCSNLFLKEDHFYLKRNSK